MATISSVGVGSSGLNIKEIITKLVDIEKEPLTKLTTAAATTNARISAYGSLKSLSSTLSDTISKMASLTTWNAVSATSSSTAVSVSATGGTAGNGFSLQVTNLAKAQSTASASLASGTILGAGTLSIQLGEYTDPQNNPTAFTPAAGSSAVSITVAATDTLADIASKINGNANAGVTATVLNDGSGERLMLTSKTTGTTSGFQLSVTDNDGNNTDAVGLSRLVSGATTSQYGENATALVNGTISVSSATNTFTNLVSGVNVTVKELTTTPAQIAVTKDFTAIKSSISAFVAAYNALNDSINEATKYDANSESAGLLQGDSAAIGIQTAMRRVLQSTTMGSAFSRLADIGITAAKGGNLEIDDAKLTKALEEKFEDTRNLFRIDNPGTSNDGVAVKLKAFADGLLNTGGVYATKDAALKAALKRNGDDQTRLNAKIAAFEARITARYTALDTQLTQLNSINEYIQQQVTLWNNSGKK